MIKNPDSDDEVCSPRQEDTSRKAVTSGSDTDHRIDSKSPNLDADFIPTLENNRALGDKTELALKSHEIGQHHFVLVESAPSPFLTEQIIRRHRDLQSQNLTKRRNLKVDQDENRPCQPIPPLPSSPLPSNHHHLRASIREAILHHTTHTSYAVAKANLRKAMIEFYRSLELLKEYRDLNITAYQKIVKKFEKNTQHGLKETLLQEFVQTPFYTSTDLNVLIEEIEGLFQIHFTSNDRHRAMKSLRSLGFEIFEAKQTAYTNLLVGLFAGINLLLLIINYQSSLVSEAAGLVWIYFGLGFPLLIANLIIVNMYVWDAYRINYRLVCGVTPRTSSAQYAVFVSFLFLIYLSYVQLSLSRQLDRHLSPVSQVWVIIILLLAILSSSFHYYLNSRLWMGKLMIGIISSPLSPCLFKDFFLADQLCSMAPFYQSIAFLLSATFASSPSTALQSDSLPFSWYMAMLPMIPFYWRAMQCIRRYRDGLKKKAGVTQLWNCSRYCLGILVLVLSTLQTVYEEDKAWVYAVIAMRLVYSLFSYYWDVTMDWGLGQGRMYAPSYLKVGAEGKGKTMIVYPFWVYYVVIATDGLTRFLWLPFSVLSLYEVHLTGVGYYLGVIELLRRFQWNFIRVEIEHVHNCERLQVTEDVDLPFQTQDLFGPGSASPSNSAKSDKATLV